MSHLEALLQQCTVKLTLPGRIGWGTGFFVAPGWILTCAHVVQEAKGEPLQVRWQKRELEAVVERSLPDLYDLALLRVTLPADANPPCVYLDQDIRSRDPLYLFGYPDQDFPNGCPVTFSCEGLTGDEPALIKFVLGQVRPGMSGSPLLNQRTGQVCGIVKFTRDRSFDLGGGAVPAAVILAQFPKLMEQQRAFHQSDQRWLQWLEGAIAANATTLPSTRATLSLSTYDPTTWVGRDTLIAALSRKLQEHYRILAIIGITGIGKTALAKRLVFDCLSPFSSSPTSPTRHFARLNFDDRALPHDFITAATTLLPKLGHATTPDDQKDPQRLLARLLQILRTTPYLVQIDSLEMLLEGDDEQGWTTFKDELWLSFFQQLLAGDECQSQFILTSQALPEALEIAADRYPRYWHRQELGGLSETEQLEIFQKNGLEPDASAIDYLKRLGQLYDGHPLVLQVIAKDILDRPFHGNVAHYWQRYQAEFDALERDRPSRRHAPRALQLRVMQRVEQSLQRLPVDARNLLCRSAVYRRPVPEAFWLAILADLPEDRQWNALEVLKSHNLAEEELAIGTDPAVTLLLQHNLIRRVAGDRLQADPTAWNDAHRIAAHLWQTAYEPAPDAPNLETLRGSLEAFHHFCELDDWTAASDILIAQNVGAQLETWAYYREMLPLYERLLGKLDVTIDVACEISIGNAFFRLSSYPQAVDHYQRSLAIAHHIDDFQGQGKILNNLGLVYQNLSDYAKSIEYIQQALTIVRKLSYRQGEGIALGNLGLAHCCLGDYLQAIEYHQQNLSIARDIGDRESEGNALGNLGLAYYFLGNYPQAIDNFQQKLSIACEIGDRRGEGIALGSLGSAHHALGNYPQAIEYHQQNLSIAREIGDRRSEGIVLVNWGGTLLKLERYTEAQPHLQTSLEIFKALGDRTNEAEALLRLAELHHKTGQLDLAREYCDAALAIATELGIPLVKECEELRALLAADVTVKEQHEG
ncbi:tetratricopeptide repeat-containing serine protease family protein [Stenomitos frigidus]|uniref:Uncharacterized protein n=1 Tax=Stenomitos frigidus ULC18 TaxID=2107698 RepID=A0A2T1DU52_9CYAN|nr:tetratricopeptide repeat-containing serine protease family protein [Stenomitos frigidus]PSB24033.1 hypothetical protein C7B82_28650 [Stenomitos frigidus ULC18]